MSRDPLVYLEHILDAAEHIVDYTQGVGFESFCDDEMLQDAIERNFEIIGEAAKRVPDEIRNLGPNIDWREISGFRDVIIHDYDTIDVEVVWDAVENEIPRLVEQIGELLEQLDPDSAK